MLINADFSKRALVIPADSDWVESPAGGVERLMLDRIGDEVARATSLVRYAAGSSFDRHSHAKGEEFLVLEGIFSDEHADYPRGSYVRNPPGSGHSPCSEAGCTIFVKLRQFDALDLTPVTIDTANPANWAGGQDELLLHEFAAERVSMRRVPSGQQTTIDGGEGGAEMFVFGGALNFDTTKLESNAWLRLPPGDACTMTVTDDALLLIKTGHLGGLL